MKRALVALGLAAVLVACQTPQWPVNGPLRSPYGVRMAGTIGDFHRGVDIAAPVGTLVYPVLDGRVRFAGTMSGYGLVVWIDHSSETLAVYAHLSRIDVEAGQRVDKNTVIGATGRSGRASGPHLHLEIWRWGREVDPVQVIGRPPAS